MLLDPGCIPCIIQQNYRAAKIFGKDDMEMQKQIIFDTIEEVRLIDAYPTIPHFSSKMQAIIEKHIKRENPYKEIKAHNIKQAKAFIPYLQTMIDAADDPLEQAVRSSIIGNAIDLAANPDYDLENEINRISGSGIILDEYERFRKDIENHKSILFIADNYEEALFDMLLLKLLKKKDVVFAVRSAPIFNDITLEDAMELGIDKICPIIESGSKIAGTDLQNATDLFREIYANADMVIAKGQGNFESLLFEERPIYFLFKVKCEVIEKRAGYPKGMGVLYYNQK